MERNDLKDLGRGISASVIIHPYLKSHACKKLGLLADVIDIHTDPALGDLDGEHVVRYPRFINTLSYLFNYIAYFKVGSGYI